MAKIYVSLPHAKRISQILINSLKEYERLFGEVKLDLKDRLTLEGREGIEGQVLDESSNG